MDRRIRSQVCTPFVDEIGFGYSDGFSKLTPLRRRCFEGTRQDRPARHPCKTAEAPCGSTEDSVDTRGGESLALAPGASGRGRGREEEGASVVRRVALPSRAPPPSDLVFLGGIGRGTDDFSPPLRRCHYFSHWVALDSDIFRRELRLRRWRERERHGGEEEVGFVSACRTRGLLLWVVGCGVVVRQRSHAYTDTERERETVRQTAGGRDRGAVDPSLRGRLKSERVTWTSRPQLPLIL